MANGKIAAHQEQNVSVAPASAVESTATLAVPHPHLWQGLEDPYLYRLVIELANGSVPVLVESLSRSASARSGSIRIRVCSSNGKHVPVHGVGCHQDREGKGWSSAPEDVAADEA